MADVAADFGMVVIDSDELGGVKTCPKTTCDQICNSNDLIMVLLFCFKIRNHGGFFTCCCTLSLGPLVVNCPADDDGLLSAAKKIENVCESN